jgi:hypothetical protein
MNMDEVVRQGTERARELLRTARHAAMATVNEDGTPHNTPFFLMLDDALEHVYFGSHPDSVHTKNVVRTGQMFVVVYDMIERGGLYMQVAGGRELAGEELESGLAVHNATRARNGKEPLPLSYYQGDNPQRMYGADLAHFWINVAMRDLATGKITKEYRHEITPTDLTQNS